VVGAAILLGNAFDIAWTTLGTHGGGPISGPTLSVFWKLAVRLHKRHKKHRILSLEDAMQGLADVVTKEFIKPATEVPPIIPLQAIRDLGIPTVDERTYAAAVGASAYRRRVFAGLVEDDGSDWTKATGNV
jgi:hypothetical protein